MGGRGTLFFLGGGWGWVVRAVNECAMGSRRRPSLPRPRNDQTSMAARTKSVVFPVQRRWDGGEGLRMKKTRTRHASGARDRRVPDNTESHPSHQSISRKVSPWRWLLRRHRVSVRARARGRRPGAHPRGRVRGRVRVRRRRERLIPSLPPCVASMFWFSAFLAFGFLVFFFCWFSLGF